MSALRCAQLGTLFPTSLSRFLSLFPPFIIYIFIHEPVEADLEEEARQMTPRFTSPTRQVPVAREEISSGKFRLRGSCGGDALEKTFLMLIRISKSKKVPTTIFRRARLSLSCFSLSFYHRRALLILGGFIRNHRPHDLSYRLRRRRGLSVGGRKRRQRVPGKAWRLKRST